MSDGKIFAISDLHVDQAENMKWVQQLSDEKYLNDTVIIAGDLTHVLSKLTATLQLFKAKFKDVYYCPGNHELWTQSCAEDTELQIDDSIAKFHHIMKLCETIGIRVRPGTTDQGVTIVPLFAWYDDSLHIPHSNVESDIRLWTDHYRCKWTAEVPQRKAAEYFVQLNEQYLPDLMDKTKHPKIVTFSHFLTSKKLMQAYRDEIHRRERPTEVSGKPEPAGATLKANFSLVAGTELLDKQLQMIKPQIHLYGHSHRRMTLDIGDGIQYINNPLGYVSERQSGLIQPPYELQELHFTEN